MLREIVEGVDTEETAFFETKYMVEAGLDSETSQFFKTNSPKDAIKKWTELQKKEPMAVEILAKDPKAVKEFYNWVYKNLDGEYLKLINKQKAYKTKYLYSEVQTVRSEKIKFGDGLHPFNYG